MFNKAVNNIEFEISDDGIATFKVDMNKDIGMSSSGKNTLIASSRGNKSLQLPDGKTVNIGINIYCK